MRIARMIIILLWRYIQKPLVISCQDLCLPSIVFVLVYSEFILARRNSPLSLPSSALGIDHNQERVGTRQRVDLNTTNTAQTSIRQDWWEWQLDVGGWHTCSAWPSPRVNLKVWLASSGLVLGGDSPSPRFSIDWRSCKHKCCLHFSTCHKMPS